jgi:acetyltransferase-like isoleucine patch superfamily enzyme
VISEETWIQINFPKDPKCRIEIGSHCFIGRRNFFSVGEGILVGDYCLFGPNCHILGAGHKMERPFVPYAAAGIENYGQVNVGVNCWLTSNVTISRGVTIGYGTVVGANSLVTTSLPPLCLAIGAPARITKVFDIQIGKWMTLPGDDSEESLARHVASLPAAEEYARLIGAAGSSLYLARQSAGRFAGEL